MFDLMRRTSALIVKTIERETSLTQTFGFSAPVVTIHEGGVLWGCEDKDAGEGEDEGRMVAVVVVVVAAAGVFSERISLSRALIESRSMSSSPVPTWNGYRHGICELVVVCIVVCYV